MRPEERHKCVVIPIVHSEGPVRFLTVRDKRFKEWTFITGGCRKREINDPLKCAIRELDEETRGAFCIKNQKYDYFSFKTKVRSQEELERDRKENIEVTNVYHVYVFNMNMTESQQRHSIQIFELEKHKTNERKKKKQPIKKSTDENDYMSFDTYQEFMSKVIWKFIYDFVIKNENFEKYLELFYLDRQQNVEQSTADKKNISPTRRIESRLSNA